jgi:predicted NAD/FAD-binding protein
MAEVLPGERQQPLPRLEGRHLEAAGDEGAGELAAPASDFEDPIAGPKVSDLARSIDELVRIRRPVAVVLSRHLVERAPIAAGGRRFSHAPNLKNVSDGVVVRFRPLSDMRQTISDDRGSALPLTRREAVRGALALAALGSAAVDRSVAVAAAASRTQVHRRGADVPGPERGRVAIIGAGAGGVAAAYFLSDTCGVDLFEARPKIGGHCDSRTIDVQGQSMIVDIGAQFFHPHTHPIYVTLLEQVGLYDPADPDGAETLQAPGSLCIFPAGGGPAAFSSLHPFATPVRAIEFVGYTELARQAVLSNMSWDTTIDDWIGGLPLSETFKDEIVDPWITALIGCSRADAGQVSARSILQTFALAFPANVLRGASTYNSRIGLQGNLERLLDLSPGVRLQLSTPVQSLALESDGWFVQTPTGQQGPYGCVVLNAPPHAGRLLLPASSTFAALAAILGEYEYFDSRILIHTDPAYVSADPSDWAAYNAEVDGLDCEGSVWYGALDPKLPSGATVDVFKSWAERRPNEPTQILAGRRYQHPLITQSMIQAARSLEPLQGGNGLYFSGVYTNGFDSQESAVYSAMKVAESLAPGSRTLLSLKALLAARGLAGISYEL